MKFGFILLFLIIISAGIRAESIEGDIKLPRIEHGTIERAFKKQFGGVVKATTQWYVADFFATETVCAGVKVKNTGSKMMYIQYYVAFYDKDKRLIGTAAQGAISKRFGLKPNEEQYLASCLVPLPKDKYKEIVSYQAIIYETDVAPD